MPHRSTSCAGSCIVSALRAFLCLIRAVWGCIRRCILCCLHGNVVIASAFLICTMAKALRAAQVVPSTSMLLCHDSLFLLQESGTPNPLQ